MPSSGIVKAVDVFKQGQFQENTGYVYVDIGELAASGWGSPSRMPGLGRGRPIASSAQIRVAGTEETVPR
jgi:hypothetical protein